MKLKILAFSAAVLLLAPIGAVRAEVVTFESGTSNPFVMTGTTYVGTPGDGSAQSLVMTMPTSEAATATWTTGATMSELHLSLRVRPSEYGTAGITLLDGAGWVASIGLGKSSQQGMYGTQWCLAMHVDGPNWNDYETICLNEYGDYYDPNPWADAWYDVAFDIVGGNVTLSVTGAGITGGLHTTYQYGGEIDPVIVLSGNPVFETDRPVLFDNVSLVPEPATMALLGLGLAGLAARRRK